jgi:hypothetical protein
MIKVDCSELSGQLRLALAEAISEGLGGKGIALLDGSEIAIDTLSGPEVPAEHLGNLVQSFISKQKDASVYHVEVYSKSVMVHSSVPVPENEKRVQEKLPPGLLQCPVCGYVTTSQDLYENHLRIHDLIRGVR